MSGTPVLGLPWDRHRGQRPSHPPCFLRLSGHVLWGSLAALPLCFVTQSTALRVSPRETGTVVSEPLPDLWENKPVGPARAGRPPPVLSGVTSCVRLGPALWRGHCSQTRGV